LVGTTLTIEENMTPVPIQTQDGILVKNGNNFYTNSFVTVTEPSLISLFQQNNSLWKLVEGMWFFSMSSTSDFKTYQGT